METFQVILWGHHARFPTYGKGALYGQVEDIMAYLTPAAVQSGRLMNRVFGVEATVEDWESVFRALHESTAGTGGMPCPHPRCFLARETHRHHVVVTPEGPAGYAHVEVDPGVDPPSPDGAHLSLWGRMKAEVGVR